MAKTRRQKRVKRKTHRRRFYAKGGRLAGHVNPLIYTDEYQMVMHKLRETEREQAGVPRFNHFKGLLKYLLTTEEVLKNKAFRDSIRNKLNVFYAEGHNYIDADREYAELLQEVISRINKLDNDGVRHKYI